MSEDEIAEMEDFAFIKALVDLFEGRADIKKRIEVLLRPGQPQTSSNINLPQVSYVQDAYFLTNKTIYPEFAALEIDANVLLLTMLSYKGFGIKSTIDLQRALTHGEKETIVKETLPQKISRKIKGEQKQ